MKNIKSLIFIPENVKFCEKKINDNSFLTLEERIKNNPISREMLRAEMKVIGGINNKKVRNRVLDIPMERKIENNNIVENTEYSGELEYIKNMTKTPLFISFGNLRSQNVGRISRNDAMKDSICIEHFIYKRELTEEQLNSPKLKSLYNKKQIMDVTYAQYEAEMSIIEENKRKESERIEKARERVSKEKESRIGSSGGFRNVNAGGIEMGEVLGSARDRVQMLDDVGIEINMTSSEIENHNPESLDSETSDLISQFFSK